MMFHNDVPSQSDMMDGIINRIMFILLLQYYYEISSHAHYYLKIYLCSQKIAQQRTCTLEILFIFSFLFILFYYSPYKDAKK